MNRSLLIRLVTVIFIKVFPICLLLSLLPACKTELTLIDQTPIKSLNYEEQEVTIVDSLRILIIGNSITRHPPLPQSGWFYNWGMAASKEEKDFVHVLFKKINTSPKINGLAVLNYENLAVFERSFTVFDTTLINTYFNKYLEYNPDLIIFRWGDNVDDTAVSVKNFHKKFSELISYFRTKGRKAPVFIITSTWYKSNKINTEIKKTCTINHIPFVDLTDLRGKAGFTVETERNFYNGGVASHPNDKGMQAIADRIFTVFQKMIQ